MRTSLYIFHWGVYQTGGFNAMSKLQQHGHICTLWMCRVWNVLDVIQRLVPVPGKSTWIFWGAPLKIKQAPGRIQGNLTAMSTESPLGFKITIAGSNDICRNDNLQCIQWWKWHLCFSVIMSLVFNIHIQQVWFRFVSICLLRQFTLIPIHHGGYSYTNLILQPHCNSSHPYDAYLNELEFIH